MQIINIIVWILLILVLFYIIAGFNKEILRRWDEKQARIKEMKSYKKDNKQEKINKKDKDD